MEAGHIRDAEVIFWHSWISPAPQGEGFFELIQSRGDNLFSLTEGT
jgi:hypothetical protein